RIDDNRQIAICSLQDFEDGWDKLLQIVKIPAKTGNSARSESTSRKLDRLSLSIMQKKNSHPFTLILDEFHFM
ncbi:MAG: hypothetical protein FWC84_00535, partial [Alphaproteobacteria bacterium]|nr:hypothetical protein [Alphaproteobacteria bacterium]